MPYWKFMACCFMWLCYGIIVGGVFSAFFFYQLGQKSAYRVLYDDFEYKVSYESHFERSA